MKKILFITNHIKHSDGVCRSLMNLTNSLNYSKYDICVAALFKFDFETKNRFNSNINVKPIFKIFFRGFPKIVSILPKNLLYLYIKRLFKKDNFDFVIAYQAGLPTEIVGKIKTSSTTKKICWIHGIDKELRQKKSFINMDAIVNVSDEGKKLIDNNFKNVSSYQLNNIVSINKAKKTSINVFNNEYFTILGLGRLSPEKGFERLISVVINLIKNHNCKINLMIVGGGSLFNELNEIIRKSGLENQIKLLGEKKDVEKYYSSADLYVCSSYSEGLSTSTIESILCDTPVISTEVPGARQIIENNHCGIVVENDDNSLKIGILKVYNDKNLLQKYKNNCLKIGEFYSSKYVQNQFDNILTSLKVR